MQSSRLSFHHPVHKLLHLYSQITLNLQSFKLKSHYVEIGVLCDLVPPTEFQCNKLSQISVLIDVMKMITTNKTYYVITMLCIEHFYVEVDVCVCDVVIRPSSTQFIMSPHHKFFFLFSSSCLPGARLAGGDAGRPDGTNTRKLCGVFIVQETTRSGHDGTGVDQNWTVED